MATLNIQRGRDHGLPGLNQLRADIGLLPHRSFEDLNPDPAVHKRIETVYNDVADVDPWVGVLAEPNVSDSMLGETGTTILRDQFAALRDGDRFFYADNLQEELVEYVDRQTLARIIRRKTDIGDELQENVFTVGETDMSPRVSQMRMRTSTGDAELR